MTDLRLDGWHARINVYCEIRSSITARDATQLRTLGRRLALPSIWNSHRAGAITDTIIIRVAHQTNRVTPGTATAGVAISPHSYLGGVRSSFEFQAMSQVISRPV